MLYRTYLFFIFIPTLFGCFQQNKNEQDSSVSIIKLNPVYITYPDSGQVKKYFDGNWNIVHFENQAKYYRIAEYRDGKIIPDKKVKDYYIDGQLQFEGYLQNENPDNPEGLTRWYYPNGQISSIRNYKNNKLDGEYFEYYETGNLKIYTNLSNGILNGEYFKYYEEKGRKAIKSKYINGNLQGKYEEYHQNGSLKNIVYYGNGIRKGISISYFDNGNIETKANYENDKLHGDYTKFYSNRSKQVTGYYYEGKPRGTWIYFDSDGDYKKYQYIDYRVGAICNDGTRSSATGRGACSWHGGVRYWLTNTQKTFIAGTGKYENHRPNQ